VFLGCDNNTVGSVNPGVRDEIVICVDKGNQPMPRYQCE
jgi:hypothetical protein